VAILKRNKEKIQKLLDIYRKPSTASRTAVKTGSVASLDSKEKPITLDNEAQKFVLLLSDALVRSPLLPVPDDRFDCFRAHSSLCLRFCTTIIQSLLMLLLFPKFKYCP